MNIIITGATGMVGKAVLLEAIEDNRIKKITLINRRTVGVNYPKIHEIIHADLSDLTNIENELAGYDACFFCMGVSVLGLNEEKYAKITYGITAHFADILYKLNPQMVFNYVSGTGTDSSEKGSSMWARVKGRTENYILKKGFKDAYMFRPGAILPKKGIKSSTGWYNFLYVLLRPIFPLIEKSKNITTTTKLGKAMISTLQRPMELKHLENLDINTLADAYHGN